VTRTRLQAITAKIAKEEWKSLLSERTATSTQKIFAFPSRSSR